MESLNELIQFLQPASRIDVKSLALHHVLSMTGSFDSRKLIIENNELITAIIELCFSEKEQKSVCKDSFFTLINLSADDYCSQKLIQNHNYLIKKLIDYIIDPDSRFADTACAIISNMSRGEKNSQQMIKCLNIENDPNNNNNNNNDNSDKDQSKDGQTLENLLKIFCTEKYNKSNRLDYLSPFICNLTQLEIVRNKILNDNIIIQRLLPYINYDKSIVRRGGIVGSIKNLCFNYDYHEKLLFSPDIDLLGRLLLPLAGPEDIDADEMNKLPEDLQYLPNDKQREIDPDIRTMLLETIMMVIIIIYIFLTYNF
jgi:hypothetical protein